MQDIVVTFAGHRDAVITNKLKARLREEIIRVIERGASVFLCGGMGAFDGACAVALKEIKTSFPHIRVILVAPYLSEDYMKHARELVKQGYYDEIVYPPLERVPLKYAIDKRNKYMADKCDILICCIDMSFGGAYKTYRYAKRRADVGILNLGAIKMLND